jgi:hypothetical protein
MKKLLTAAFFALAALSHALAQVPNFPQTLPANSVVGRLGTAGPSQAIPFASLVAGLQLPITATSATSVAIGTGTQTFTLQQTGKSFVANQWALIYSRANSANSMLGQITSYSGSTLVVSVSAVGGSGTKTDWNIVLANSIASPGIMPPVGTGNVVGPGSATDGNLAVYDGATGKLIKDSGISATAGKPFAPVNVSLTASVSSNILTINLLAADIAGTPTATHPVIVPVRDTTATTGAVTNVTIAAATSINTNATGATLGSSNSVPFRIWIGVFNNGGTGVLALFNASTQSSTAVTIKALDETGVASTTAISGGATSAGVWYTPNGTTLTNKAFRIVGYVDYDVGGTLATAGTYSSAPTKVQVFGPGVKLPGQVVQTVYTTTTTTTSNSSTTKSATALTGTITPTSGVNPVKVSARGQVFYNTTAASGNATILQLYRGTGTTAIGNMSAVGGFGGTTARVPVTCDAFDSPQSITSTQYGLYIVQATGTNTSVFLDATTSVGTNTGVLTIEEIQG